MKPLRDLINKLISQDNGAAAVEYAILISGIAVAIAATIASFGSSVQKLYQEAVDKLK